jgi:hypothetical protein
VRDTKSTGFRGQQGAVAGSDGVKHKWFSGDVGGTSGAELTVKTKIGWGLASRDPDIYYNKYDRWGSVPILGR